LRRALGVGIVLSFVVAVVTALPATASGPQRRSATVTRTTGHARTTGNARGATGYRPLHPDAYYQAKQRAYENASNNGKPGGGPKPPPPPPGPGWAGQYETDLTPPDPTGAIGPTEYIELINLRYGIYNRSGTLLGSGTLGALTNHNQSDLSDPQILWDPATQRFYYTVLDVANDTFAFGFSKTTSPGGPADFCQYTADFGYGGNYLPDYPKMGDSSDFIMIGANVFLFGFAYVGSDLDWLAKPPPGASCPSSLGGGYYANVSNADGSQLSTPVPAVQTDPSGVGWVVGGADVSTSGPSSFLTAISFSNDGTGNAVLGTPKAIPIASYDLPPNAPEKGSSNLLDTLDARFERAVAAPDPANNNVTAVWTAHAVAGGAGSEERWYEINPAAGTVLQSGKATSPSLYVWNGAVSPDRAYNGTTGAFGQSMVMGFNTSSSSTYPAIQMVTKRGSGAQSGFTLVKQASGPNVDYSCSPCRWGDYSGASPDPAASQTAASGTVWLSGEWNNASRTSQDVDWRTWNWFASP